MHTSFSLARPWAGLLLLILSLQNLNAQETLPAARVVELNDIYDVYAFGGKGVFGLRSMADGQYYTRINRSSAGAQLEKFDYATGTSQGILFTEKDLETAYGKSFSLQSYSLSSDEKSVVLESQMTSIYRHSYTAMVGVYQLENKKFTLVSPEPIQNAQLSPNGQKVAYVRANNIYLFDIATGTTSAITTDGIANQISNGAPDWVYEEEFSFSIALWWSPNSEYVAYLRFDETDVHTFSMDVYGTSLYPSQTVFKYPKAGEDNSKVSLWIYSLSSTEKNRISDKIEYEYIPRVQWTPQNALSFLTLNRWQNELTLYLAKNFQETPKVHFQESDAAYIDITDDWRFLPDGSLVWSSDRSGFNHLYWISADGKKSKPITRGSFDVTSLYGVDAKNRVYYQAAARHSSQREVYVVPVSGGQPTVLSNSSGTNDAQFSQDMSHFILTHSSAGSVSRISLHRQNGSEIRLLEDNKTLKDRLKEFVFSPKEFFTLTAANGQELPAWQIKPLSFDPTKKYPVLMFVYGGPGSQQVLDQFGGRDFYWFQHLASKGYWIVCVDNRGTGGKGREFKKCTYQKLGQLEVEDQIAAAQTIAHWPQVDPQRIGIWGWSYGGYMSANCLLRGADVFKTAIAVAPVTNWRYYDNIYTERYMRTPQENGANYDSNSPQTYAAQLKGNFLLVHGTGDDNVHVQNSMRLAEALIQANKPFDYMVYPDKNHGIAGGKTRMHLFTKMTAFLMDNL